MKTKAVKKRVPVWCDYCFEQIYMCVFCKKPFKLNQSVECKASNRSYENHFCNKKCSNKWDDKEPWC